MRFQSQISQLFGDTVLEWCSFCWKRYNTIREILSFSLSLSPTCFHLFFRFVFVSFVYLCEWKSMSYWQSAACTLTKAICLILQIKSLLSFSLLYIWMGIDLCSETQFIVSGINAHQNDKWEKYVISRWHLFGVYIYIFCMSVAQASCVIAAIRIGEKKETAHQSQMMVLLLKCGGKNGRKMSMWMRMKVKCWNKNDFIFIVPSL